MLEAWLEERTMQSIAAENNLAETAFFVRTRDGYDLRWFTPSQEVDLCGHATLASAFVIFHVLDTSAGTVTFSSKSGPLSVVRDGDRLSMRFPRREPVPCDAPPALLQGLGVPHPLEVLRSRDYLAVYGSAAEVRSLKPDMNLLSSLDALGVIVSAPGEGSEADFVSRFFAPGAGVSEDPATGSSHCTLVPYWARRLERTMLHALQVSARGGELFCKDEADAVVIAGSAVLYLDGMIQVP